MRLSMFARLGRNGRRLVWGGALTGLLLAASTTVIGDVSPEAKRARGQNDSFSLFAGPTAVLTGNQLQCGLNNQGYICTDVFDSPTGGGGFWPVGSPNAYIFNTGLQIAGIIQADGGPWANDTTAAFFFDPKGTTQHGSARTSIYDSLNPDDLANWPDEARIADGDPLFQPVLWGRNAASQQDSWVKYWDGDPSRISGRIHPLGVEVTQRSLAWNYPAGNESLIYFIYKFENVSDAADFRQANNVQFFGGDDALPADGYTIGELYGAFGTDMDITSTATENFSTAILPFDVGISYHGGFSAPEFAYPPDLFYPPFFTSAPGLIGIKYLRSPIRPGSDPPEEVGLTLFSANLNQSDGFPDPQNDKQLWRYLSGRISPAQGDNPCNVEPEVITPDPNDTERSVCFIYQESADTRFFQSSGPFSLGPDDEPATIVVAYIAAATVATMPDGTPSGILANQADANANPPGDPSFHPGFTSARACSPAAVAAGDLGGCVDVRSPNPVKPIERGAGWFSYTGPAPSGRINGFLEGPDNKLDQFEVLTVPNSLLGRALVAQSIFDSSFLLGFAPDNPAFYLVPGDNQVTVIWEESATETLGDPFYQVASDPASPLYNPNYREFDVEGYRVWRGSDPGTLALIAQFDKSDSQFFDYTCETVAPDEDVGAERDVAGTPVAVVGYVAGEDCPFEPGVSFVARDINSAMIFNNGPDGGLPGAGVARLADLSALGNGIKNVIVDDDSGPTQPATDTGIPFFYNDNTVVNNFTYFYAVSAFNVNSQASGPNSLRSARVAQSTVPRKDAPDLVFASLSSSISGDSGEPLNPSAPVPSVDPETGIFSGPFPPTNGVEQTFAPLVPRLLPQFELQARIDSVKPDWTQQEGCGGNGWAFQSVCYRAFLTVNDEQIEVAGLASNWNSFGRPPFSRTLAVNQEIPFDPAALEAFGIPAASGAAQAYLTLDEAIQFSNWEGQQNRRGATANTLHGGPRWFNGTEETLADPTAFIRVGRLAEVDSVFIPIHHTATGPGEGTLANSGTIQYFGYYAAHIGRSADFQVTWTGGTITVRDITHGVDVPFSGEIGSSWGFLNDDADGDGTVSVWDFFCIGESWAEFEAAAGAGCPGPVSLSATPTIHSISMSTAGAPPPEGNGFTLYLNAMRHFFRADALPPDGTVWTFRAYNGVVTASSGLDTFDPSGYRYVPIYDPGNGQTGFRSPLIPGLTIGWSVESNTAATGPVDLTQVHTVPDPYLATSQYDLSPTTKQLMFVNLPPTATIRIYTLTGVLVDILNHEDVTGGGRAVWNLRNRNNQFIASGVYFYHVVTPEGDTHVGKFTVVNFGAQN